MAGGLSSKKHRQFLYQSNAVSSEWLDLPNNSIIPRQINSAASPRTGSLEAHLHNQLLSSHNGIDPWNHNVFNENAPITSSGVDTLTLSDDQQDRVDDDITPPRTSINPGHACSRVLARSNPAFVRPPTIVDVLANDYAEDGINAASVTLYDPSAKTPVAGHLSVADEGIWRVNAITGAVTFTPNADLAGNPTPVQYSFRDSDGDRSNLAQITIIYADTFKDANTSKPLGKTFKNPVPIASESSLLISDNFDSGSLNSAWETESGDDSTQLVITDLGEGDFALESFVDGNGPFGVPGGNGKPRAEITYGVPRADSIGRTFWWTYQMYIVNDPMGSPNLADDEQLMLHQVHGKSADEGGATQWRSPKISMRLGGVKDSQLGNIYSLRTLNPNQSTAQAIRLVDWSVNRNAYLGRWVQVTYRAKLGKTPGSGFMELWIDGNKVVEEDNIQVVDVTQDRALFKWGTYIQNLIKVRYDNISIWEETGPDRHSLRP